MCYHSVIYIYVVFILPIQNRTGKTPFARSAPDQLPFAESTSFPEGLSSEAGLSLEEDEKEKTEMM